MRTLDILCGVLGILFLQISTLLYPNSAEAMGNWSVSEIARIAAYKNQEVEINVSDRSDDTLRLSFDLTSKKLRKRIDGYLKRGGSFFESSQKFVKYDFPQQEDSIVVYEIVGEDPYNKFWALVGTNGTSRMMDRFYLIGPYGDGYTIYITKDSLKGMGFRGSFIEVSADQDQIILSSMIDNNDGYGHYQTVGQQFSLTWDDESNWFSISYDS